jgi:ABC-type glycerol-3-phosphate transport system substrate-binding protein
MLEKYGLKTPTSRAELAEAAKVLRDAGQYPLCIGAKDDWINLDVWMNIANGVSSEKLYKAIAGEVAFTDADLVKSFEIWKGLFDDGIFQDGALGVNMYTDTTDLFDRDATIPMIPTAPGSSKTTDA